MSGHGMDVEISSLNVDGKIKWSTDVLMSFYKDRITSYYLSSTRGSNFISFGEGLTAVEGGPAYGLYSYRWAGLDPLTGDPRGYLKGQVSKDYTALTGSTTLVSDLVYNGPQFPTLFGSAGNTISWKNISLTARVLYKFGYYFRRQSINYTNLFNPWIGHSDYSLRWQKPGDESITNVPSLVYPAISNRDAFYAGSEILVDRGDNIRLQYINLSYDVEHFSKHFPVKRVKAFIIFNNPGILWRANKEKLDPVSGRYAVTIF